MEFVNFEIAVKLKEKGFSCEMPFAMYNEIAAFHLLTTSAPYNVCDSVFKYREYYDYEDFDEYDYIAPTISQVLKWLRKRHFIHISTKPYPCENGIMWMYEIRLFSNVLAYVARNKTGFDTPELAELEAIEYVVTYNLI